LSLKYALITLLCLCFGCFLIACAHKADDFTAKKSQNPVINHKYSPEEGDYFGKVLEELNRIGVKPEHHHFQNFPVKYWIGPMEEDNRSIVKAAIEEYSYFFPMKEVKNKEDASLIIELTDFNTLKEKYPDTPDEGLSGVGGVDTMEVSGYPFNIKRKTNSIVLLLPHAFEQPVISQAIIMHEIGHAFGIAAHSDDPYDIMYDKTITVYNEKTGEITVNNIPQTVKEANTLSVRDLNTIWLLYNHW